tara:strand:+ start:17845 stop:18666 length:822 start_codon:yes stop_codon:yes gene_type:complete
MAKFKQEQIIAGVTKTRSNALKVYCSEAISANDILVVTGTQGDFLQVAKADADGAATLSNALLFVADYAAASGDYTPVALPYKLVTGLDTSTASVGDSVYLSTTAGGYSLTTGFVKVGTVVSAAASGAILFAPQTTPSNSGTIYGAATSMIGTGAQDVEVEIVQPAGTVITDIGHVTTTATVGAANIVVRVGTASDGEEVIADSNYVSSGVSAIGESMQVANGSQGEAGAAMTLVAKFPVYTAAARTLYYRFQNSATITAGVIRPFIKVDRVG